MPFYQVRYTHAGDQKIRTFDHDGVLEEEDVHQLLVEHLNFGRNGARSFAEVLQRNDVTVDGWEETE